MRNMLILALGTVFTVSVATSAMAAERRIMPVLPKTKEIRIMPVQEKKEVKILPVQEKKEIKIQPVNEKKIMPVLPKN